MTTTGSAAGSATKLVCRGCDEVPCVRARRSPQCAGGGGTAGVQDRGDGDRDRDRERPREKVRAAATARAARRFGTARAVCVAFVCCSVFGAVCT